MKTIFLDSRERDNKFTSLFINTANNQGYKICITTLPIGDIKFQNILIERKEINDFYSSVSSDRMWEQISHMRANPNYSSIIIINGRLQDLWELTDTKVNVIMGAQKRITALGIPLIWCNTNEEFVFKTLELFEYATSTDEFIPIKRVEKNKKDSLFMALPSIGRKNGKILIDEYCNMCELCNASLRDLQYLIGPKRGELVYDTLRN